VTLDFTGRIEAARARLVEAQNDVVVEYVDGDSYTEPGIDGDFADDVEWLIKIAEAAHSVASKYADDDFTCDPALIDNLREALEWEA
jgi:hypothetical protein